LLQTIANLFLMQINFTNCAVTDFEMIMLRQKKILRDRAGFF